MIPQRWITGNATRGTYPKKEIFLQSCRHVKREGNTHDERVDWALALTVTACLRLFCPRRTEMDWDDWLLCWWTGNSATPKSQSWFCSLCVCVWESFFFGGGGAKKAALFPWSFCWKDRKPITRAGSRSRQTRRRCWESRCRCRNKRAFVCQGLDTDSRDHSDSLKSRAFSVLLDKKPTIATE